METISTASRFDALCSAACVREAFYHLTNTWCTEAQALAACFSVPDGATASFAALNVGVEMHEGDARAWVKQRAGVHAALGMIRGSRRW